MTYYYSSCRSHHLCFYLAKNTSAPQIILYFTLVMDGFKENQPSVPLYGLTRRWHVEDTTFSLLHECATSHVWTLFFWKESGRGGHCL
jgi:hypothetical protein